MNIIGDAYVDIHARDKNFEKEVRKMARDIKPPEIKVVPKVLMTQANKTLREFHSRNAKKQVEIKANLNTEVADRKLERLVDRFNKKSINFKVTVDGNASKILNEIRNTGSRQLKLNLNTDNAMKSVKALREAIKEATEGHTLAEITAKAQTTAAELALATAARDRSMTIHADTNSMRRSMEDMEQLVAASSTRVFRIFNGNSGGGNPFAKIFRDPEIAHAVEGFANATAGVIPLRAIKSQLTALAGGFESLTTAAALVGTVLLTGLGAGTAALGSAVVIAQDIAQIAGGVAAIPAIVGTVIAATQSLSMAWQGMGKAISTDAAKSAKAMAKLPPKARETAKALREVNVAVNEATDKKYWDTLGDSVQKAARAVKGPLTEGMGQVAVAMAQNTTALANSVQQFATSGDMKTTFDNMVAGMQNAIGGTRSFSDAILTLTTEGSKRIPLLGDWFSDTGKQFNDFIEKSAESGAILGWIDTAVTRLKELGTIVSSTATILGAIGQAASDAGIGGLTDLANGFKSASDAFKTSEFKRGLVDIFGDAKIAAENLASGLGTLFSSIASVFPEIGDMGISASEGFQAILEHMGSMFTDTTMMSGFQKFFEGVRNGLQDLGPSFESFGNILGDLGEMGGVLFENMAPGLNILMGTIEGFISNIKDGFMAVNPVLNNLVQVFTNMISGPIKGVGALIGGFLTVVSKLPLPIIGAVTAIALLTKGLGLFKVAMATAATTGKATAFTSLVSGIGTARTAVATHSKAIGSSLKEVGAAIAGNMAYMGQSSKNWSINPAYAADIDKANSRVKTSFSGLKGAVGASLAGLRGLMAAAWPMAAIGAVIAVFMHFQEVSQQAKASVESFADGWDASIGGLSTDALDGIENRFKEIGTSMISDWGWQKSMVQNMETVGISVGDVQKKLSGSKNDVKAYADGWNSIEDAFKKTEISAAGTGKSFDQIRSDALDLIPPETFEIIGKSREELEGMGRVAFTDTVSGIAQISSEVVEGIAQAKTLQETLTNIGSKIPSNVFDFAENGGESTAYLRDTLAGLDTQIGTIMDNYDTLNSQTASLDQKTAAFRNNLTQFNLEGLTDTTGLEAYHASLRGLDTEFATIKASAAKSKVEVADLFTVGKDGHAMFDWAKPAAGELKAALSTQAEAISGVVTGAYDTAIKGGETVRVATDAAKAAGEQMVGVFDGTNYVGGLGAKLQKEFGLTGQEVNALIDTMGLVPSDIETAINVENADEATQKLIQVQVTAAALASGNYAVVLDVLDEGARSKIVDTLGLAKDVTTEDLMFQLEADATAAGMTIDQLMIKLAASKDPEKIILDVQAKGAEQAYSELQGLKGEAATLAQAKFVANITAETGTSAADIQKVLDLGKKLGTPIKQTIEALYNNKGAKDQMDAVIAAAKEKVTQEIEQKTKGKGKEEVEALKKAATDKIDQLVNQKTTGDALPKAKELQETANKQTDQIVNQKTTGDGIPKVKEMQTRAGEWTFQNVEQTASGNGLSLVEGLSTKANENLTQLVKQEVTPAVMPTIPPPPPVKIASEVTPPPNIWTSLIMPPATPTKIPTEYSAPANNIASLITQPPPVNVPITADSSVAVAAAGAATSAMSGIPASVSTTVTASSNAAAVLAPIPGQLAAVTDRNAAVTISSNGVEVAGQVVAALNGVVDKDSNITANNTIAMNAVRQVVSANIPDKTSAISMSPDQALGAINTVNGRVVNNKTATITITTINRSIDSNADGGMFMGGVRTFAKGGISKVQKAIQRHQKIGGGENRTAQIAKGSENYRVWGETETGGEAYLPLGKSKRARSLKILKQVMDHFGIVPGESFADGGILNGKSAGNGVTTYASGGITKTPTKRSAKQIAADKKAADARKEAAKKAKDILNEMNKAIRDFVKALGTGLDEVFNRNRGTDGQKALYTLRDQGKVFVSEFKKTRPKEAKKVEKFNKELLRQSKQTKIWNGQNADTVSARIANDAQKRQKNKSVDYNSKFTVRDYEKALDRTKTSLESATSKLDNLVSSHKSQMANIATGLFGNFDLASLIKSSDEFGYRPPTTAKEISSYAKKMVKDMKDFKNNIAALRKAGYNEALIADISQMGLAEGLAVSAALLADKSQKKSINSDYSTMFGAKGQYTVDPKTGESMVAGLASNIGKYSADMMYGAGVNIQKGLVKGLTDDVKALEKAGQTLSDALVKKFKKLLGIKSPSRVFLGLGKFIPQGLVKGIDSQKKLVNKSLSGMVNPSKVNLTSSASSSTVGNSSDIMDRRSSSQAPINLTINPSQGMSEEQIGKSAARELMYRMDSMTV